jgi:hypothetical protein
MVKTAVSGAFQTAKPEITQNTPTKQTIIADIRTADIYFFPIQIREDCLLPT